MACGCNKSKSVTTINSTKKVDISAAQRKISQNLPLISIKKSAASTTKKISKR